MTTTVCEGVCVAVVAACSFCFVSIPRELVVGLVVGASCYCIRPRLRYFLMMNQMAATMTRILKYLTVWLCMFSVVTAVFGV